MMMGLGFLGMLLFWGILVALFVGGTAVLLPVVNRRSTGRRRQGYPQPRDIVDERLARGEIDSEEYDRIRALIDR